MNWTPVLWIYVVGAVLVGGFFYLVIWTAERGEENSDRQYAAEMRHYADRLNTTSKGMALIFGLLWPMTLTYALTHLRNRGKK